MWVHRIVLTGTCGGRILCAFFEVTLDLKDIPCQDLCWGGSHLFSKERVGLGKSASFSARFRANRVGKAGVVGRTTRAEASNGRCERPVP
jgi:hypothetical protein